MSRFKQAMKVLFNVPDPKKVEAGIESARVKALKLQVQTLEDINEQYSNQIKSLTRQIHTQKEGDMQEKIVNGVMQMFAPQNSNPTPTNNSNVQTTLESGKRYTDSDLTSLIDNIPAHIRTQLANMPVETFKQTIKGQIPDISEESLIRGRELLIQKQS